MSYAAVVFDFFATLTPSTPEHVWQEHTARSAAPLGLDAAEWRRALDESWAERATGALGNLPATFRPVSPSARRRARRRALAAACAARRDSQGELIVFRPDGLSVLAEVRARGLKVGVLSDCTVELAEAWPRLPVAGLVDAMTQRQWSEAAIRRTTPALLGLFSLVTLLAQRQMQGPAGAVRQAAWYRKRHPTFADALALVRRAVWRHHTFPTSPCGGEIGKSRAPSSSA